MTTKESIMDSKNFAIGVLSTTAVILFVGLLVVQSRPEPAYAFGMNAQGGDYLLTTGQMQPAEELLYVIDAASQKMLVYRFDINTRQIIRASGEDLDKLRQRTGDSSDTTKRRGTRGRGRGGR
jgi:hypothetical protein